MINNFIIHVNGLAAGESFISARADKEFFVKFENYEVLDAALRVSVSVTKTDEYVDFDCSIDGTITVPCDRCLNPVAMPVSSDASFRLRRGRAPLEDSQEEVFLTEGSDEINLDQEIYDYSLLALPLQRFHSEGECDPAALECLSDDSAGESSKEVGDTPFSNLAQMLKDNKKQ